MHLIGGDKWRRGTKIAVQLGATFFGLFSSTAEVMTARVHLPHTSDKKMRSQV
jgi:hypothetical protein